MESPFPVINIVFEDNIDSEDYLPANYRVRLNNASLAVPWPPKYYGRYYSVSWSPGLEDGWAGQNTVFDINWISSKYVMCDEW
jgi:hypothetical protein